MWEVASSLTRNGPLLNEKGPLLSDKDSEGPSSWMGKGPPSLPFLQCLQAGVVLGVPACGSRLGATRHRGAACAGWSLVPGVNHLASPSHAFHLHCNRFSISALRLLTYAGGGQLRQVSFGPGRCVAARLQNQSPTKRPTCYDTDK